MISIDMLHQSKINLSITKDKVGLQKIINTKVHLSEREKCSYFSSGGLHVYCNLVVP